MKTGSYVKLCFKLKTRIYPKIELLTKACLISGVTENLQTFFETQNSRDGSKNSDMELSTNRLQHSISCFPGEDQEFTSTKSSRLTSALIKKHSDSDKPRDLIVHFYTFFPTMGLFLPSMLEEFARLLFDIDVDIHAQSTSASKIVLVARNHVVGRRNRLIKNDFNSANNNINAGYYEGAETWSYKNNPDLEESQASDCRNKASSEFPFDPARTERHKSSCSRKRRVAKSDFSEASKNENFFKYTARLKEAFQPVTSESQDANRLVSSKNLKQTEKDSYINRFYSQNSRVFNVLRDKKSKKKQKIPLKDQSSLSSNIAPTTFSSK